MYVGSSRAQCVKGRGDESNMSLELALPGSTKLFNKQNSGRYIWGNFLFFEVGLYSRKPTGHLPTRLGLFKYVVTKHGFTQYGMSYAIVLIL